MNEQPPPIILAAERVIRRFPMGERPLTILQDISLDVRRGERLAIRGASGAGKTTLLQILGGLDRPNSGKVWLEGRDLYAMSSRQRSFVRARSIGFVFQSYHLLPELDVLENVLLPALSLPGALKKGMSLRARAADLLDQVGLRARAHHLPRELSGGEQQRTALARALMNEPDILLADEPTGNLDSATGEQVLQCLFDLVKNHQRTLLLVSHDDSIAQRCDRVLVLKDGRNVE